MLIWKSEWGSAFYFWCSTHPVAQYTVLISLSSFVIIMVFSNNTSDTLNSLFSINSIWRIIIVQTLIKKGALNAYF
ncbi:TPA_asm: hypothetical protein GND15_001494 [Salmonella enterica subsp. salamae serovar 58:d:z6]|uniref:Uncharacterized protein n=1 Tax=Salmonella enterica subsp. salamae serovar 58:d:z6 TaxID=41517 RepID=A0A737SLS7_SALER|nr:hypothetical protein [Salmonella enterica subsp. salamae str. CFSAN000559]HAE2714811.1 hypothetical protein [Salmonella enterica subsp. salamae serovar 58:d:z6]HAE2989603.1 hypothetical protein [Salmonella enterica subsp. salamae serovar 58:d:z6]HAE4545440.1 hypothetical protein [Salmonella enterica subsp. salamae serovar 58:d:z6]HAE8501951.1 hypothetical protein [Salmonella enterica subsp. salamae serovar 58:d:z6]